MNQKGVPTWVPQSSCSDAETLPLSKMYEVSRSGRYWTQLLEASELDRKYKAALLEAGVKFSEVHDSILLETQEQFELAQTIWRRIYGSTNRDSL